MSISHRARVLTSRLPRRPSRRAALIGVAAVVAIGGSGIWMLSRPDAASATTVTAEATVGTFETTVTGAGTIEPSQQADLDFPVSGRVIEVSVEPGDTVAKGEVLASLDTASLDASRASAQAQLEAAATAAANDGSDSSVQRAANDASVASATAGVAQAEDDLAAASLRATFAGTVAAVTVEVGDQVGSSASGSSGGGGQAAGEATTATTSTAAVTVISPTDFIVDADVAADDIAQVKAGLQVTVTPNGATEDIFGTVSDVARVAEADSSGAATFPVTVKITGEQEGLYAGTSADISIVVKQVQDVLTVPTAAVTSEDGVTYVDKIDGSSVTRTKVEIGQIYGTATEITSGVAEGDAVQITATTVRPTAGGAEGGGDQRGQGRDQGGLGGGRAPGGAPQGGLGGNQ